MALIDELKKILEREKLYVQDKFEEWVHLAKTTHQTIDRVLATSGYLTEAQMLRIFGECLGIVGSQPFLGRDRRRFGDTLHVALR